MLNLIAPTSDCRHWRTTFGYAAALAARLNACLTGLHVSAAVDLPNIASASLYSELIDILRSSDESAIEASHAFEPWAKAHRVPSARWFSSSETLEAALESAANWHDIVVLHRPPGEMSAFADEAGKLLVGVPLPFLLLPSDTKPEAAHVRTIAIAWNGSRESLRAVHSALPLLRQAERVEILQSDGACTVSCPPWTPPLSLAAYLADHEVRHVRVNRASDGDPDALFNGLAGCDADLFVMGAYGSARYLEWLFGGATEHALHSVRVPLFLRH